MKSRISEFEAKVEATKLGKQSAQLKAIQSHIDSLATKLREKQSELDIVNNKLQDAF